MPITHTEGTTGLALSARIRTGATTSITVPLPEVALSGNPSGIYEALDAAIEAAGLTVANTSPGYTFDVLDGDGEVHGDGLLRWDGEAEVDEFGAVVDQLDNLVTASLAVPTNQVPVPPPRTWILKHTAAGLVGERTITRRVGESPLLAADFREDLATNGRLIDFLSVEVVLGDEEGLEFNDVKQGVDRTQAKFEVALLAAGTYVLLVRAEYDDSDGGGEAEGLVTLEAVTGVD